MGLRVFRIGERMPQSICSKHVAMTALDGFTRQETLALTGTTSSRLAYLDRSGIIIPQKYGNPKKPTVIYSWEQILEVRAIQQLRQQISLQQVRRVVQFLERHGLDTRLHDKHLVVVNEEVYLVLPDWSDMPQVMTVAGAKGKAGQMVLLVLPPLAEVVDAIWDAAQHADVVDFESFKQRAKAIPRRSA